MANHKKQYVMCFALSRVSAFFLLFYATPIWVCIGNFEQFEFTKNTIILVPTKVAITNIAIILAGTSSNSGSAKVSAASAAEPTKRQLERKTAVHMKSASASLVHPHLLAL